jgi:hypothetical protein
MIKDLLWFAIIMYYFYVVVVVPSLFPSALCVACACCPSINAKHLECVQYGNLTTGNKKKKKATLLFLLF